MTEKQRIIFNFVRDQKGPVKKSDLTKKFGRRWYFANASKNLGDVLTRMVNQNWLVRVKPGYYEAGTGKKHCPVQEVNENQLSIFDTWNQ